MLQNEIVSFIESLIPKLVDFRREMHRYPELGMSEVKTTARIKEKLDEYGIKTSYVKGTIGLYFTLEGDLPGDTILLRGDMDCLPIEEDTDLLFKSVEAGKMHACGHDLNTTYLLGTAIVLNKFKQFVKGKIIFLFQPAEEILGGAKESIRAGIFSNDVPKAGFAFHAHPEHNVGKIAIKNGDAMAASDQLLISVHGKGGHAGYPHAAIDPVVISAHIILAIQSIVSRYHHPADPLVITIATINGGKTFNVIPSDVEMTGCVRVFNETLRNNLPEILESTCKGIALSFGGDCNVSYIKNCPPLVVPQSLFDLTWFAFEKGIGEEHFEAIPKPSMGSEDFAFFAEIFPCIQIRVGTQDDNPRSKLPLHNAKIVFSEESIKWGVLAGCSIACCRT